MPRMKIDYVVSFSSEDPENPANTLLAREVSKKKWLCKMGESSCSVVLQLTKAVKISAVHIGAYHAALVEVLVGRSEKPDEQFQVLVPSSVFVSPSESRRAAVERVRSFSGDQLGSAARQRWDRVRVVCSQPYNKHCKYGLSFIHLDSPEEAGSGASASSSVPSRLFNVQATFSSDEEEFRPGELFATHVQGGDQRSIESQIRQASSHAMKNIPDSASRLAKTTIWKQSASPSPSPSPSPCRWSRPPCERGRDSPLCEAAACAPHAHTDGLGDNHTQQKHEEQRQKASFIKEKNNKKDKDPDKKAKERAQNDDSDTNRRDAESHSRNARDNVSNSRDKVDNKRDKGSSHNNLDKPSNWRDQDDRKRDKFSNSRNKDDSKLDASGSRDKDNRKRDNASNSRDKDRNCDGSDWRDKGNSKRDNAHSRDNSSEDARDGRRKRPRDSTKHGQNDDDTIGPRCSSPLRGVVFALSGYQNPTRAKLRDTGLRLGAQYERDWTPKCTHLICAFPNTPKLKQLRARGTSSALVPAVRGEWVWQCGARGRRLPWRWFATEPQQRAPPVDPDQQESSERDTDDEIQEALRKQKKPRRNSDDKKQNDTQRTSLARDVDDDADDDAALANVNVDAALVNVNVDIALADVNVNADVDALDDSDVAFVRDERIRGNMTVHDSDSDNTDKEDMPDDKELEIDEDKCLPNFFDGYTFSVDSSVGGVDERLIARYVRAYGGVIVDEDADYVVCGGGGGGRGGERAVPPRWLWDCHRQRQLLATTHYHHNNQ